MSPLPSAPHCARCRTVSPPAKLRDVVEHLPICAACRPKLNERLVVALQYLSPRQREAIVLSVLVGQTLDKAGWTIEVSRERVRQIRGLGLRSLSLLLNCKLDEEGLKAAFRNPPRTFGANSIVAHVVRLRNRVIALEVDALRKRGARRP